jgi:hypothetical protein
MKMILVCLLVLSGCTSAEIARGGAKFSNGKITCYSGGKEIYAGTSEGRIEPENKSDGWYFMEANTKRLIRISGDCVIEN